MNIKHYITHSLSLFQVIPEALLSIFDFQELELFMCGLPTIDIEDWKRNTEYKGTLLEMKADHNVVKWWWEVNILSISYVVHVCFVKVTHTTYTLTAAAWCRCWRVIRMSSVPTCSSL